MSGSFKYNWSFSLSTLPSAPQTPLGGAYSELDLYITHMAESRGEYEEQTLVCRHNDGLCGEWGVTYASGRKRDNLQREPSHLYGRLSLCNDHPHLQSCGVV
jgi:hypothetical protein